MGMVNLKPVAPTTPERASAPTGPSLALAADVAEAKGEGFGTITVGEGKNAKEFEIARKPNALLLAELARTESQGPQAIGVLADFFEQTLTDYAAFKKHAYSLDLEPDDLTTLVRQVAEATIGRPIE